MTTPTFNATDIVNFAAKKDAVNLATAFDQLVGQRVVDAIQNRKQEVASTMFNPPTEQEGEEEQVVADDEQEVEVDTGETEQTETEESDEDAQSTD